METLTIEMAQDNIVIEMDGASTWNNLGGKPTAVAENSFIVSGPSPFAWVVKTLAQLKTILGLGLTAQAAVFANPLALDGTTYKDFKCSSVTGDTTVNLTGLTDGDAGIIELIIDGTGGYTIALGTMFTKNSGGGTIDNTAAADNIIAWMKIGSDIVYSISQIS